MDLGEVIETIDKYCVNYIRFILSVTTRRAFLRRSAELDPNIITFSVISVFLGNYLYGSYISHHISPQSDMLLRMVTQFSIWLAMSLIAYVGVAVRNGAAPTFTGVLVAVLRVMPSAFVLSCYLGVVVNSLAGLFDEGCSSWWAYTAIVLFRSAILLLYLPFALQMISRVAASRGGDVASAPPWRTWFVGVAVILAMVATDMVTLGWDFVARANAEAEPIIAVLKLPDSDPRRIKVQSANSSRILAGCLRMGPACPVGNVLLHALVMEKLGGVEACLLPR